jgi:zinc protease
VLGLRKGSRLHRALVRERQVAAEVQAFTYDLTKGRDLVVVDVTARPEVSAERLEEEVAREVDVMHEHGVSGAEVERAVALIQTDMARSLQSAAERADQLSRFATYFGDPSLVNEQLDRYRAVTAAQVSAIAREYVGRNNRASLLYVPRAAGRGQRTAHREEEPEPIEARV